MSFKYNTNCWTSQGVTIKNVIYGKKKTAHLEEVSSKLYATIFVATTSCC